MFHKKRRNDVPTITLKNAAGSSAYVGRIPYCEQILISVMMFFKRLPSLHNN